MLKKKALALAVCLAMMTGAVSAQEKYSKVIIYPASSTQRTQLIGEFQIDHFMEAEGGIVSEISARSVAQLKARGIKHRVLVSDVAESLRKDNARFFADVKRALICL